MSDSHFSDSYPEPGVDSSSPDLQNEGQKPSDSNGEDLKMDLDASLFVEPSLEEELELTMDETEFDSTVKFEDQQFKQDSNDSDLKMESIYNEEVLKGESLKSEVTEHTLKHDSEHSLKIEGSDKVKFFGEPEDSYALKQEEREIVGLFEDSDEFETSDTKSKSSPLLTSHERLRSNLEQERIKEQLDKQMEVFEEKEVIRTTLNSVPKPQVTDNLAVCRFPPTLTVLLQSDVRSFLRSNPHLLDHPPNTNTLSLLCFRQITIGNIINARTSSVGSMSTNSEHHNRKNTDSTYTRSDANSTYTRSSTNPNSTPTSHSSDVTDKFNQGTLVNNLSSIVSSNVSKVWDSNGKLVVWEDGSVSMFVGRVPLDCESVREVSFLLEDGRADLKPVHAQVNVRLQTRFSDLHTRFSNLKNDPIKKKTHKRQKMEVASLSEAIQSHHALQQNLINIRESERQKKIHYSSKGLTRSFLESSDNEDGL